MGWILFSGSIKVLPKTRHSRIVEHPNGMIAEEGKGILSVFLGIKCHIRAGRLERFKERLDPVLQAGQGLEGNRRADSSFDSA